MRSVYKFIGLYFSVFVTLIYYIDIYASHYPGVIRALDTLYQIIEEVEGSKGIYRIKHAPITINDEPEFAYRGVMIDTSREYYYIDTIKQLLDGMMYARLNVFHWHFIDSDSIPMYSETYPDMTNYTAFQNGRYMETGEAHKSGTYQVQPEIYTPKIVKEIVDYAKIRGIKVVPEFEGPAHLNALGLYPEFEDLINCFQKPEVQNYAQDIPPNAVIDVTNPKTYEFLENFMKDMAKNFDSDYWHLGGNDVDLGCLKKSENLGDFLSNSNLKSENLPQYYISKVEEILHKIDSNKVAGYWYNNEKLEYQESDILQYTGSSRDALREVNSHPKNKFILSPIDLYHMECGYSNYRGGGSRCGRMTSWKSIWMFDTARINNKNQVLGGEALVWSEMTNEFDLFTKLFPRSAAMSFKYWNSQNPGGQGTAIEMLMRLQYRLKARGIPTERICKLYLLLQFLSSLYIHLILTSYL